MSMNIIDITRYCFFAHVCPTARSPAVHSLTFFAFVCRRRYRAKAKLDALFNFLDNVNDYHLFLLPEQLTWAVNGLISRVFVVVGGGAKLQVPQGC